MPLALFGAQTSLLLSMNPNSEFDILETVRKYIATATPEQIQKDIAGAEFEKYTGIGDEVVFSEKLTEAEAPSLQYFIDINAATLWSSYWIGGIDPVEVLNALAATPLNLPPSKMIQSDGIAAGKTEEMPFAA